MRQPSVSSLPALWHTELARATDRRADWLTDRQTDELEVSYLFGKAEILGYLRRAHVFLRATVAAGRFGRAGVGLGCRAKVFICLMNASGPERMQIGRRSIR